MQKIVVSDLKENTFYALIYLARDGEDGGHRCAAERRHRAGAAHDGADLRGGHASSRTRRPIDFGAEQADAERLQKWLESLDPDDLGKYKM